MKIARQYERDIIAGRIPACKWVRLAIERNVRDRARQRTPDFPYYFDTAAAVRVCYVKEQFTHVKGPKAKPLRGAYGELIWQRIILEPWQVWFWTTLFGWKRIEDDWRRFRIAFYSVPRKNAKSTDSATTSLYMVSADGEGGAECHNLAVKKDQARLIWSLCSAMARRNPEFREFYGVQVGAHAINVPDSESILQPLSSDANTLDGLNTHFATIDEFHAHKTRDLYDVIETSTGARDQPLIVLPTTAGVNMDGICYELLTYLHKVLEGAGTTDETFFGVDYTIDAEDLDHWDTELVWRKANPNYGISVKPDDLARLAAKARVSPASRNNFLTKRLNVWVKAEADANLLPAWKACYDPTLTLEQFKGATGYIGIDLAEVSDIAAKIRLFPRVEGGFAVFGNYYLPRKTVETSTVAQYAGWVDEGCITPTEGDVTDYLVIEDDIEKDVEEFAISEVCFDRALAGRMVQNLRRRLGEDTPIVVVPQDWPTISGIWEVFESLVRGGEIVHNGDPVLMWMISNVALKQNDKDEKFPVKAGGKLSKNKIDGVMALLSTLVRATAEVDEDEDTSVYSSRVREGRPPLHIIG